jgi:large conductance mechanosensitive channel
MLKEFKEFALRGNVLDMAVGIIIGAAFTTIVKSAVDDIIMPIVGVFTGGVDFSDMFINLSGVEVASLEAAKEAGHAVIAYGIFINAVITFLIVAFVLFMIIRNMNKLKAAMEKEQEAEAAAPAPTPREQVLLEEIRDLLKARA